jgi:hypothetical protein
LQLGDEGGNDYYLPRKPLTDEELVKLINKSRKSDSISMEDAHDIIRKSFHAH